LQAFCSLYMRKLFFLWFVAMCFVSCGEYQKALNGEDVAQKYQIGEKMYQTEKYGKAIRLFEQIAPGYRGRPQAEKMFYMYAKSSYEMKKYPIAVILLERFITNYTASEKIEEAWLLLGRSYAHTSPKYSLDQEETHKGINKLQEFLEHYPESEHESEINKIITELNQKIEKKYFEIAKQYNTIAEYTLDYRAAIVTLDNFMLDYPGSIYTEDALYYKFDSLYKIAINSVQNKKKERLEQVKEAYNILIRHKAETKYKNQADRQLKDIEKELKKIDIS